MGELSVDGRNGASVKSAAEMVSRFYAELMADLPDWERRLAESPGELEQLATQELQRDGVQLNVKAVRRIALQCGERLLALRKHEIEFWRESKLPAGTELHGKRVTVQIDGGRIKIRGALRKSAQPVTETNEDGLPTEDAPGRSKRKPKRTFAADWREPKLVFASDSKLNTGTICR